MSNRVLSLTAAAVVAASVASYTSATAAPVVDALAIKNAAAINVEQVQWRGFGWGFGAGLLGGAIIGGALARPYYYGPGPYYYGPAGTLLLRDRPPLPMPRRHPDQGPVVRSLIAARDTGPTIRQPARSLAMMAYAIPAHKPRHVRIEIERAASRPFLLVQKCNRRERGLERLSTTAPAAE